MSNLSFLDFQYKLSKLSRKPSRLFSSKDRQDSSLLPTFQLNLDEMKRVFDRYDSNKDGKISQEEYKTILKALRKESTITDVPKIFQVADLNGDGFIDFNEFVEVNKKEGGVKTFEIQCAFSDV
ncbi:hypothetical protein L1049_015010 [Liquidambar formosana]|uniref:EF-hand domain-containing protein n=1 Tax=Liquidambar formosana TaxID=63359 RepID=A0AAP0S456_LIQFO